MSLLIKLPEILEKSKREYDEGRSGAFAPAEIHSGPEESKNRLAKGDNLTYIKHLMAVDNLKGCFQMIYIDPPFFSQADYGAPLRIGEGEGQIRVRGKAYTDTWERGMADYLTMLCLRFYGFRDLLRDDGTLWVHLDWHSVHYVKILLDEIFGADCFINEVVWTYKSGGTSKRHFARKHDTLLFYGKGKNYFFQPMKEKSYNRGLKPYRFKGVEEYRDEVGWYTLVNQKDVWQLDMVGRTSGERTGYATQKPEALISRILETCTRPGDLCGDFFCGSGTLGAVANRLGRNWICCDQGDLAISHAVSRLAPQGKGFTLYQPERQGEERIEQALPGESRIQIKWDQTPVDKDHFFLTLTLTGFRPDTLEDSHASKKDREKVDLLKESDPLSLVHFWSVDFSYDGVLHRGDGVQGIFHGKGDRTAGKVIRRGDRVSIKLRDSFGREYHRILEMKGEKVCLE